MSASTANARKSKVATQLVTPKAPVKRSGRTKKIPPPEITVDDDKEDTTAIPVVDSKATMPRVIWNSKRTDRLVEWLENNVEDRQRLFSDSAQDAKEEKCCCHVAKNAKTSFHIKMAEYIFSADEDARVRDDLKAQGAKQYAKAVENRIMR